MNPKRRVKTYEQIKKEQELQIKQKQKAIKDILTSAKNNPKFAKLLSYSFTSLDKMITPPNSDARLNAKLIIEMGGIDVLRSIALKNEKNEEICKQIADITVKLTSLYEKVDPELAQKFVEAKGHEAIIEILLKKQKGPSSIPLIKCLNNLCQVSSLINKLLDAGISDTIKLVNDLYSDDINVIRMNLDTMKKISNQKNGRDILIKKGIIPSLLMTIKKCCEKGDAYSVFNGLTIVDNICRNDEGKKEVKNADAPLILCDVVETFSESAKIINKSAKILSKIMTKEDLEKELEKLKNCSTKLDTEDSQETINEVKDSLALVSNLMLVDELGKIVCLKDNFDMLTKLFNKLCKIDLTNKKPGYVKDYIQTKKHFLTLFKRAYDIKPEYLDEKEEEDPDASFTILFDSINESIKKSWNTMKPKIQQLEKEGDKEGDLVPLKNAFKGFFGSYCDIVKQKNDRKTDEEKKNPKWIELLNYLVGDIIPEGKKYFGEDEKPNYSASKVLKIADETVQNHPDNCLNLPENLKKCFPYMKDVVGFSDFYRTLANDLQVISNTIKNEDDESSLKNETIPVVTKFMENKYKFRNPNLICLNILEEYLKPEFVSQIISKNFDENPNINLVLNYVNAIDSVMAKPFYTSSVLPDKKDEVDELDKYDDEQKEPKDEEVERQIIVKGSSLLKKLIPLEEFKDQVKDFKKNAKNFNPEASKAEDILKLEDNLIYQLCALNVDEFFNEGMNDDFNTVRDLIRKELTFIESFKRLKSNENNPKYKDICEASNKRLHMMLGTLRKLEDQGIDKYCKLKGDQYKKLLQDIIDLNSEVISKSTDSPNLITHLAQLRNNIPFLRENEKELSDSTDKTPSETYISSLVRLLNKSLNDEELCDSIIKTLISLISKKNNLCNLLVKLGCPRTLLQIMDKTQNRTLANDAMELLKMITLSSKENAEIIGNQNILMKLFEIRSKFSTVDTLTRNADLIANELMKLPGQSKIIENLVKEAIKEFHQNLQKDFKDNENKQKILNNEDIINSFTSNQNVIKLLLDGEFIKDLNKACDLTTKDEEISTTIDKLLTNEMGILTKIKDNLPSKEDVKHDDIVRNTLSILLEKSNFEEPLLLACKCLIDYLKNDALYNKHLCDKINENFVDKLFEIQDNYLDSPEVIKEINNILCYLALRNPKLGECIIKRGGLANIIEELKSVANLNDPASKLLKLNGLKMLNTLLNNKNNLDEFLKSGGADLINKIVKNEVDITPKTNDDKSPDDKYLTKVTIFTKTPEQLQEEEKMGINSFTNLGLSNEEADKKRKQILNDLKDDKSKDSTSGEEDNSDDSDNYFVQCLKIINKALDNDKNELVDDKIVQNLTNLASNNFPNKSLFNEVATILSNKNVKLNPDAVDDLKDLMKLGLSNRAQFYGDGKVGQKVKAIEEKIANMLLNNLNYKTGFRNAILRKGLGDKNVPGKLSDDRWGDMPKRKDDEENVKVPGKLNDDRWGDLPKRKDVTGDNSKVPGKLNDDRWDLKGDRGKNNNDDDKPLPGKLKNPFDNQNKEENNNKNRPIPGKLKNPFNNNDKSGDNDNKNKPSRTGTRKGNNGEDDDIPDGDLQEKNKLLTYISLVSEPESFNKLLGEFRPEICTFFNSLYNSYKPVVEKILNDKENKINTFLNKNRRNKNDNKDSQNNIEPFNLNSLSEKEKYDSGVVLSLAKLYNKILDDADKNESPDQSNEERFKLVGDTGEPKDAVNNPLPGKLKNPFDKNKKDNDNKIIRNISRKDPKNRNYLNNLEIMADPIYTPENYIFVNQFNKEMDKIMEKLGKYEEEQGPEEDQNEVTENYLNHLSNLFTKVIPFLDDLHKEINSSPTGTYPDLKQEKEDNFDTILTATEEYYKTDEDNDIKANYSKNMCDVCLNLIDDFTKDGVIDKEKEKGGKPEKLRERTDKLWDIINNAVKNDINNQILEPSNNHRVRDMIKKINDSINKNKCNNLKKLRYIPYELANNLENGEDNLGQDLLDFVTDDLEKHGDDEEIEDIDYKTIAKLSKFPGLMKQIMKNPKLWDDIKKEYSNPKLMKKKRGIVSTIMHHCALSNYNIENMINEDPDGIKAILHKMIHEPIDSFDDQGDEIATMEVVTLCDILKDKKNYELLKKNNILNDDDINRLDGLYMKLDPKLAEPLRRILSQIKEDDKTRKEKEEIAEDEKNISDLQKRIGNCFESHKRALLQYLSGNPENFARFGLRGDVGQFKEEKEKPLPGKLKNPFDGNEKDGNVGRNRAIPGKLNNPFGEGADRRASNRGNDILRANSSLRKMSFVSGALYFNQADNARIKSSLSNIKNPKITNDINKIITLLRKNYNDIKTSNDQDLNIKRIDNVHKCLTLLKQLSLAPDNHKPILEAGFMSFMEELDEDYKLFKEDGEPNLNNKGLGFEVNGKNVLQACSNSPNAIQIISESPVFDSTINEVTQLYEKPKLLATNNEIQKLFLYDNVIFSNLCKNKTAFEQIFNKIGLNKLLSLGQKTDNINLLDAILNMIINYVKNTPNKDDIPPETLDAIFSVLDRCINLRDRTPELMTKVLDLSSNLYTKKISPRVDNLNLFDSMSNDINNFKNNHGYLNSCLAMLNLLTKDNPENTKKAIDSGLLQKLNDELSQIVKDGPEKYEANKGSNEEDQNGYLKTCYNLAKLYNNLIKNDKNNAELFNKMGITDLNINMLNHFNDIVEPLTEEEKAKNQNLLSTGADIGKEDENINNKDPKDMVRDIMKYCGGTLDQITSAPHTNEFLSTNTTFSDTITKTVENENNELDYMITALHALGNHLFSDEIKNWDNLDLEKIYNLLHELQSKYYSNPEVLTNVNYIAGALVKNLKNDDKGKQYTKKFYDLIPESTKIQDYNPDLVNMSLKLMYDGLVKKPYLVDEVYEVTIPTVLDLLKLYKDNPEIQENIYKVISLFANNHVFALDMINKGLIEAIKETLSGALFSDGINENNIGLKSEIYNLIKLLCDDLQNCPGIAQDLMSYLISKLGEDEEVKKIVQILNQLLNNNNSIPPFIQYDGIDECIKLLDKNDENIEIILNLFQIFKHLANASEDYKKILKNKGLPNIINRVVKKVGSYDKRIEMEGRKLSFDVNLTRIELENPDSIVVEEIKIEEPIPPECRNFLTSGRQVKIINNNGDVKQMQLIFSQDLMKVSAKKIKSNLPPKPKYIIDTLTIKKVLKGHGTDAFQKSKGMFRKVPPQEICFSIIGPTSIEGTKSLNVECESEKEVDKWIKYIQIVINYFKKTKAIKGAVLVKTKTFG